MQETMKMAGAVASHALWNVSDGATLSPLLGFLAADLSHRMERVRMDAVQAFAYGNQKLDSMPPGTLGAVFVRDGYAALPSGRTDALIVDVRFADDPARRLQIHVPYRNARHPQGFAVHKLKLAEKEGLNEDLVEGLFDAFIVGIESHEQGNRLWKEKYLDEVGEGEANPDFTSEELGLLKRALFHVLLFVGRADGKIDKKEIAAFDRLMRNPDRFGSALLNRIAPIAIEEFTGWFMVASLANTPIHLDDLATAREIVDRKLSGEDSRKFKLALVGIATEVANTSGGFFSKSKVSKKEQEVLDSIASGLGLAAD